jgi:hypothetical protein
MSKALEREMAKLAAMGITVTTTARAGEDSIAGRIQAAAERQGIAGNCSNRHCRLERAHSGPCWDSRLDPESDDSGKPENTP